MKQKRPVVALIAIFSILLMYVPSIAVAVFSVNDAVYGLTWRGFTLRWYQKLIQNEYLINAALNTLVLAVISTLVSTILGSMLAIGITRCPWSNNSRRVFDLLINLPVVVPDIIMGVALALAFNVLRMLSSVFDMGMITLIVAHVTFQISFVALVVKSRLESLEPNIDQAAQDLYASTFFHFIHVTFPLIRPAVIAGAMLAFTLSLDDFIISFFNHGPKSVTLPIFIYSSIKRGLTPEIHALSTVLLIVTAVPIIIAQRAIKPRKTSA
jgi:spermidine/putrescine transport system permease protein